MRPVVLNSPVRACYTIGKRRTANTYRAVVALDIVGLLELAENILRKDLAELNTHLVYQTSQLSFPNAKAIYTHRRS